MPSHADPSQSSAGHERSHDRRTVSPATTTSGIAAISAVLAGVTLAMVSDQSTSMADKGPTTPDLLPDPASTALPDPPFPGGLTPEELQHLTTFDELDFTIFSNADWARLGKSHARNIRVHWPDGHYTDGIDRHIRDMDAIFQFAPDTHIRHHPLRIAKGNLTCVTGVMAGTFTRPMPDGKGGEISPTNKPWAINMATIGIWNSNGTMDEEFLFWDNQAYYSQLGIG